MGGTNASAFFLLPTSYFLLPAESSMFSAYSLLPTAYSMMLLDGAMGTELARRGANVRLPLWSANALIDDPGLVRTIHEEYIAAGADIITTNTFRTTQRTFRLTGIPDRSEELTSLAVDLAKQARAAFPDRSVRIAGSIAPLEDCYRPDLVPSDEELAAEHALHARRLANAGVDMLLCETMGTAREAHAACTAATSTGLPTVVSFLCSTTGDLYDGHPIEDAVEAVNDCRPWALALNCISPRFMRIAIHRLRTASALPFGVYANVGLPGDEHDGSMECDIAAEDYIVYAQRWAALGATFIGGCCGTTPEYIRMLRKAIA